MKQTIKIGSLLLVLVAFVGCATMGGSGMSMSNWGTFQADDTVRRNLEAGNLDPNLNYYYSGSTSKPNAIIGLNKRYVLDNNLWQPVSTPAMCIELCQTMKAKDMSDNVRDLQGFLMLGPDGKKIGVWYSEIYVRMRVKMGEGNKVIVYTPDQPYQEDMGD